MDPTPEGIGHPAGYEPGASDPSGNGDRAETVARHPSEMSTDGAGRRRRRRRLVVGAVALSVALITLLLSFGLGHDPTLISSPLIGKPAPDFDLRTLDGTASVQLGDLRGQIVVVNFWASWCAPCRVEQPNLIAAWRRYRDQGVVLVGIPFLDQAKDARAYAASSGGGWPLLEDQASHTALAFGVTGVPETFFVDRAGKVQMRYAGAIPYDVLAGEIDRLLSER